ncbi:unnamed protein product [Prunus armeniaca]|uniref:Uncharacterized protein n=1 Tax=Prunus armeniaca TaxID=36596 RepID=A0A6J5Y096_PRUAR|nr:unnamed protein product [Prunus armeniaca]
MTQWGDEASDGEDDSPLIVKKRKRTMRTATVSEEKETAQVQAETKQGVGATPASLSSPVETMQTSQPKRTKDKEQRTKRVQVVVFVRDASPYKLEAAQTSPAAKKASLLSYPKIHELAEKPGSGLPEVLQIAKQTISGYNALNSSSNSCSYETQIVPLPQKNVEIAPSENKGKNVVDQPKGKF